MDISCEWTVTGFASFVYNSGAHFKPDTAQPQDN